MKKAFTMLELVMVIVLVGIISVMIAPSFETNNLRRAAEQVVSHIRYTQHLAMMDNKFDPNDDDWYLGRWQIVFSKNSGSDDKWSYTIFSDWKGGHDGNPNPATSTTSSELAYNPIDNTRYLTGGTSGTNIIHYDDKEATKELNIGNEYGIANVSLSGGGTGSTTQRVIFDNLGRPYRGITNTSTSSHIKSSVDRLVQSQIVITLTNNSGENIQIAIEPETGYAHIL
ncbi:Tfp pilus assembly protein FimT/FimU [Sulfurospirillum sp. 1307]|jgi:prepilin-type N-terminal cleavage/methylation domain-containing protein